MGFVAATAGNIKGTGIVGVVRGLRAQRDAALAILPAALHHYLDERVVITAWYPETENVALISTLLRLYPKQSWEGAGQQAAHDALTSVYRNIIVEGDVPETARRMRVNWRNYHDTGNLAVELAPRTVRVIVASFALVSTEFCRLNTGYFGKLLALAGAQITRTQKLRCTAKHQDCCIWEYEYDLST